MNEFYLVCTDNDGYKFSKWLDINGIEHDSRVDEDDELTDHFLIESDEDLRTMLNESWNILWGRDDAYDAGTFVGQVYNRIRK